MKRHSKNQAHLSLYLWLLVTSTFFTAHGAGPTTFLRARILDGDKPPLKDFPSVSPSDEILLNCGSSGDEAASDGRLWVPDDMSHILNTSQLEGSVAAEASASTQGGTYESAPVPYKTARISQSKFTYRIPVEVGGPKFVRLHFYPDHYPGFYRPNALFSVSVGNYTLLSNFNASRVADAFKVPRIAREYIINVDESKVLSITFTPSSSSRDFYAFVNGIEIVSMPQNLYSNGKVPPALLNQSSQFQSNFTISINATAFETLYRLNVGGSSLPPSDDTGFYRLWSDDTTYLKSTGLITTGNTATIRYTTVSEYTAPPEIYATARTAELNGTSGTNHNITWSFPIDPGFYYLVRLHFCEINLAITRANQRVFQILINNQMAEDRADVFFWSNGSGIPVYRDYVVFIANDRQDTQFMPVAVCSKVESRALQQGAILNGIEIFKLSNTRNNLSGLTAFAINYPDEASHSQWQHPNKGTIIAVALGASAMLFLIFLLVFFRGKCTSFLSLLFKTRQQSRSQQLSIRSYVCREFPISEIKQATRKFSSNLIVGTGGFGEVYKGYIDNGATAVAIKRGKPNSHQGLHEFETEISMLSKLRHQHLVSLIGYCLQGKEMILVYDFMANGTLRDHLYRTQKPPLPWKLRLKICIGAARGLHYLHTCDKFSIIHRDVKTTNILLDEQWVPKVSDFGLSKVGPTTLSQSNTHVSTAVKGSFGYLDPEYCRRRRLTEKSDVYSFGVVLLEVLCARPAVFLTAENEAVNLAEWALSCLEEGSLCQFIDPYLKGKIPPECFKTFTEIASKCLADKGTERPTMGDVLCNLEEAWQLQVNHETEDAIVNNRTREASGAIGHAEGTYHGSDTNLGAEFSDIMVPIGR